MGLALLFQGKVTKFSLKKFGLYGHTTFCHSFQIVRGLLLGFVPTPAMQWLNGVLGACAHKTLLSSPLPLFSSAPFLRAAASITLLLNYVCHEPVLTIISFQSMKTQTKRGRCRRCFSVSDNASGWIAGSKEHAVKQVRKRSF